MCRKRFQVKRLFGQKRYLCYANDILFRVQEEIYRRMRVIPAETDQEGVPAFTEINPRTSLTGHMRRDTGLVRSCTGKAIAGDRSWRLLRKFLFFHPHSIAVSSAFAYVCALCTWKSPILAVTGGQRIRRVKLVVVEFDTLRFEYVVSGHRRASAKNYTALVVLNDNYVVDCVPLHGDAPSDRKLEFTAARFARVDAVEDYLSTKTTLKNPRVKVTYDLHNDTDTAWKLAARSIHNVLRDEDRMVKIQRTRAQTDTRVNKILRACVSHLVHSARRGRTARFRKSCGTTVTSHRVKRERSGPSGWSAICPRHGTLNACTCCSGETTATQ